METRSVLRQLTSVFKMIEAECQEKGVSLPADTTEIVNA
jgi:hypothetical protein